MKYAIVQLGGFQYTLEEGKEYTVPKFNAEPGKKLVAEKVLAAFDGKEMHFGKPSLTNIAVTLEIKSIDKGEKVVSRTYKAKSRYHKTKGHRKLETRFVVKSISELKVKKK